jgi:nicotinamidase/pyrazinamidase
VRTIVLDIDTQRDFMEPGGGLYVAGAETILPALRRVLESARAHAVPVVCSVDAHAADDPEFHRFPPHCIQGTRGQEKVPETRCGPFRIVPNAPTTVEIREGEAICLEKQGLSLFENVNFDAVLSALQPQRCVVVGVATEYCVRAAALGLRNCGLDVAVVVDAVRPVDAAAGDRALKEMRAAGVRTILVDEAVELLAAAPRKAGRKRRRRPR